MALGGRVSLAGYRPFGRAPSGGGEPTFARTLLLEAGGLLTGIVLLELMTLPPSLVERIAAGLEGEGVGCALVAATHTHSGPGSYDRDLLPQAVAIGRFDEGVERALVDAVLASLASAKGSLAPANLSHGEIRADLAWNRDRRGEPVDDRLLRIVLSREDGGTLATVVRAAAHPTLSERGSGPHGDWPGALMRGLEERGGVAFVLQGAVGDARADGGEREAFASRVASLLEGIAMRPLGDEPALGCAEARVALPPPDLSAMVPGAVDRLASNLVVPVAPEEARMVALRLGDLALLGVPGEPTFPASLAWEGAAPPSLRLRTVGLSQGYAGYVVREIDRIEKVFSARNAWFGSALLPRISAAAEALADALDSPPR